MKTNCKELNYYCAELNQWNEDGTCKSSFGFCVNKEGREVFTVNLANELIEFGNKAYKEKFGKEADFNEIRLDMTDYAEDVNKVLDDGVSHPRLYSKKKLGKYDKKNNVLRIFVDDIPVYENNNGKICKDSVALADSLM